MPSYFLSNRAIDDLSAIWEYTYEMWSELQAEKYYHMLLDTCQNLADGNFSGKPYSEIGIEVFGYKAGRHIIFFRKAKGKGIEIARILHEQMDLNRRILE